MDKYTKAVLTVIAVCLVLLTTKEVVIETADALTRNQFRNDLNNCLDGASIEGTVDSGYAYLRLQTDC